MVRLKGFLEGFRKGFQEFGHNITLIINSTLLTPVYFLGVGLTSVIARLFGKKFLEKYIKKKGSYWSDLNLKKKKMEDHYRQF
ncbi:MAG TPA: hypothetical protein VJB06_01020 [archaeon]|nr:hypothetical protein [archaeon]